MKKQILTLIATLVVLFGYATHSASAQTFVPCDANDVLCQLDCDLDAGVCGQWVGGTTVTPDEPPCPDGQIHHPTAGTCIYGSDAACRSVFGDAYYNGNEIDGCGCVEGAVYSHTSGLCELPNQCPDGQSEHPDSGNCIWDSDADCEFAFGAAYYDGNSIDGCGCLDGAIYSHESGLCEFPAGCPDGM
ncbi:hypothetical protein KKD70_00875, partial [Patescibacteria group bacterium]|nr:hypothetical protein [Patescibacteria group bacterium]